MSKAALASATAAAPPRAAGRPASRAAALRAVASRSAAAPAAAPAGRSQATAAAPAAQVLRRFRLVFNAVKTHFRQVEKKAGVGGAQVWALAIVREQPGIGVGELARAMDIHQSTASNLIRSLVEQQLLAAEKAASDRRAVQLRLLPAGQRVLRRAPGPFTGVLPQALASLDRRTLMRLDRDLATLIAALGVDERGAGIPLGQTLGEPR